jgi:hypothetical protein
MKSFLARHASKIKGVLHGFDRIRFRGTLRWLANTKGMMNWLTACSAKRQHPKTYGDRSMKICARRANPDGLLHGLVAAEYRVVMVEIRHAVQIIQLS